MSEESVSFNSLRYLGSLCVSAVSFFPSLLTAESQRTQSLRRENFNIEN